MNTRKFSSKQEKDIAKKFGTKVQIGSGATPFYKGDGIDEHLFIECKTNTKQVKSIAIKKEWLEKAKEQAYQMRKGNYALVVNFGELKHNGMYQDFVVIEDDYFEHLYKSAKALDRIVETLGGTESRLFEDEQIKEIKSIIRKELFGWE